MTKERKWIGFKDIVVIALLTALSLVIQIIAGIPFTAVPQLMMFVSVAIIMVLCGPIYVLMLSKAPRRGAAFLFSGLMALYFVIIGQFFIAISYLLCAFVCECIMLGNGYQKPVRIGISYMVFAAVYVLGSFMPYLILADRYNTQLVAAGVPESSVNIMMKWFASPVMILLACLSSCVFAALGAFVGYAMLKKHFRPAGVV